jgi:2-dehydro-3-deoxygluconokinase
MGVPAVVGLGELMLRLSPEPSERLEVAQTLRVHAAGAEANVAAGLARLGLRAALVTALPESSLGRRAAGELAAAGVDLSLVDWHPGARMGTFFVEQGSGARTTAVSYDRAGSAFADHARWPAGALEGAGYAVVSGITPALSERSAVAAGAIAREARSRGVVLCVDVNYRARLWSAEAAREGLASLLAQADVLICSASDAAVVFGPEYADPAALREHCAPRARVCVITRGEHGCAAVGGPDETITVEATPTVITDRLGIGDAFVAGLIYGLLDERPLGDALRAGTALAALKATVAGDFSLTRKDELEAAIAQPTIAGVLR